MLPKKLALLLTIVVIPTLIKSEYLIYKVNPSKKDKIDLLSYEKLSKKKQNELWNLYYDTVYRYQWPTVRRFWDFNPYLVDYQRQSPELTEIPSNPLSYDEKQEYLNALQNSPYGLFKFIKDKVEKYSLGKYSLLWVPTTVFELVTLSLMTPEKIIEYKKEYKKYNNPDLKSTFIQYCATTDTILQQYRFNNHFIKTYNLKTQHFIHDFIKNLGETIIKNFKESHIFAYATEMLPIIKKYLKLEQTAFKQNAFLLSRGTNGYHYNDLDILDFELGSYIGLSYGYSLFAGTIYESNTYNGARSISYMTSHSYGYAIMMPILDYFEKNLEPIFSFPPLTTIQEIFGLGEQFHPRLQNFDGISHHTKQKNINTLAQYLSDAIMLSERKDVKYQSNKAIKQSSCINQAVQKAVSIEAQEQLELYTILKNALNLNLIKKENLPEHLQVLLH